MWSIHLHPPRTPEAPWLGTNGNPWVEGKRETIYRSDDEYRIALNAVISRISLSPCSSTE